MALAALVSSLALLAASPAHLQLAQADAAPPPAAAAAAASETLPAGAPDDDYGFVGWCYGALSGHVDLYDQVLPEVKRIETAFPDPDVTLDKVMADYAAQHSRGKVLLTRYEKALKAEETKGKTGGVSRDAAIARGREIWTGSDKADARQLAQLWMSWGLPGRCDRVAGRIVGPKGGR